MLIVARIFQGIGGGAILALTLVVIGEIVSPLERGKYMGIIGAITGLCAVVGPFIGGLITDHLTWSVPIGCVAIATYQVALKLPKTEGTMFTKFKRVDYGGVLLSTSSTTLLLLACSWGGVTYAWGSGQVVGCIVTALALLSVFIWWEGRVDEPVVPLSLFTSLNYVATNVSLFGLGWILYGARYVMFPRIGAILLAVSMGMFSLLDEASGAWLQVVPQVVGGFGMGMALTADQLVAQTSAPDHQVGPATTVGNFIRYMGGVLGIAVFATITQNITPQQSASSILKVAAQYELTADEIELFSSSLTAQYSGVHVDLTSLSPDALNALRLVVQQATVAGLHYAFISAIPLAIVGFVGALFVKHVPLKNTANVQMETSNEEVKDIEKA
ncbi:hypothetical protein HDU93_003086 [Gonapodya sp. JEL0774]|nr:hypothetical protein HDU93_003086 [Gonapodya sp. JEL0774]